MARRRCLGDTARAAVEADPLGLLLGVVLAQRRRDLGGVLDDLSDGIAGEQGGVSGIAEQQPRRLATLVFEVELGQIERAEAMRLAENGPRLWLRIDR